MNATNTALDAIDRKLLNLLRLDARRTNNALAAEVGLSPSACLRRVRLLEDAGVIRGYTVVTRADPADHGATVIVQVTLERQTEEYLSRFEAAVRRHPEIQECWLMAGQSDYWLRAAVESAAAYEALHTDILSRLPGVTRINSSFAMRNALMPRRRG
ncbi:Lrp/AsnC family transcriptional regulator [Sphingomonas sp. 2R-10]|uniref:Lrp/AsnC family transcriptional regulator n=1 Tax=Sphingomonas sp. 2R-10 TaxID=3045148 RepID=UPI000F7A4C14|nr:Lrp/AsnC family transcriptional regulator [Sphingomonas sp. 2R-10]MDJ0278739.1 Lrp/AsnC family transcriptional regulator [Sphingomonas sp. 2R-10]